MLLLQRLSIVNETWLRPDDRDSFIASVTPPGYKCTHVPRPEGRGGGVGFFIHDDIDFKVLPQPCFNTFDSISVHLSTGNALDIVFNRDTVHLGRDTFSVLQAVCAMVRAGLSDHLAITLSVNIHIKAPCKFRQVNTQKIHKIKITDFREDILNSDLIKHPHTTASLLSHQYFNTLRNILDKHASIKRKLVPLHPDKGFVNSGILSAKRLKCKCERVWRNNNSAINRSRYRAAVNRYNFLLEQPRCRHYSTAIAENNGNPKALWNIFKKILHKSSTIILPDHISPIDLANILVIFSVTKLWKSELL